MNGGVKASLLLSCAVLAGCTAAPAVEVRAIANPSAALSRGGDSVAVARGQLMLGNAGLALEGFRKAQRENPSDPAALAGIGDCYSAMGRFDLAQTNYEAALALAPRDRRLLLGLADVYEREGKTGRAMIARAQAAALQPATAAAPQAAQASPKPVETAAAAPMQPRQASVAVPTPAIGSITVELPEARPADRVEALAATPAMPQLAEEEAPAAIPQPDENSPTQSPLAVVAEVTPPLETALADPTEVAAGDPQLPAVLATAPEQLAPSKTSTVSSVTVEMPTARPAERLEPSAAPQPMPQIEEYAAGPTSVTAPLPPARPAAPPLPARDDRDDVAVALAPAPRLERLSRGEVALVTTAKPMWSTPGHVQMASATTSVRWVALESSRDRPNVRILNAARSQGLAASARTVLFDRGWRKIAVGDAPEVLRKSVVLYPKGREALGRRLARQFGVSAQIAERDDVVLILGRDSIRRIGG